MLAPVHIPQTDSLQMCLINISANIGSAPGWLRLMGRVVKISSIIKVRKSEPRLSDFIPEISGFFAV